MTGGARCVRRQRADAPAGAVVRLVRHVLGRCPAYDAAVAPAGPDRVRVVITGPRTPADTVVTLWSR